MRAGAAVKSVGPALVMVGLFEIGQHVVIGPAGAAQLPPRVIVQRVAAGVDLRVDAGPATDHLSLRIADDHILHVLLRNRLPAPGPDALGHFRKSRRHVIEWMPIAAPGL